MHINDDYIAGIHALSPYGTNSTMFTECCSCAITDTEKQCPECGRLVVGHDAETDADRGKIRWDYATANWRLKFIT